MRRRARATRVDGPFRVVAGSSRTYPASGQFRFCRLCSQGADRIGSRGNWVSRLGPDAEQEEGVGHGVVSPGAAGAVLEVGADVDGLAVETFPGKQGPGLFQA